MKIIDIWINCPSEEVADRIAGKLIERRLVACANRFPPIASSYRWKGGIEQAEEVPLLVKTRDELFDAVEAVVLDLHPYETPSLIGIAVDRVNGGYLDWIYAETVDP